MLPLILMIAFWAVIYFGIIGTVVHEQRKIRREVSARAKKKITPKEPWQDPLGSMTELVKWAEARAESIHNADQHKFPTGIIFTDSIMNEREHREQDARIRPGTGGIRPGREYSYHENRIHALYGIPPAQQAREKKWHREMDLPYDPPWTPDREYTRYLDGVGLLRADAAWKLDRMEEVIREQNSDLDRLRDDQERLERDNYKLSERQRAIAIYKNAKAKGDLQLADLAITYYRGLAKMGSDASAAMVLPDSFDFQPIPDTFEKAFTTLERALNVIDDRLSRGVKDPHEERDLRNQRLDIWFKLKAMWGEENSR